MCPRCLQELPGLSDLGVGTALTQWVILTAPLYLVLLQCWPVSLPTQCRDQEPGHVGEGTEGSRGPAAREEPAFLPSFLLPASSSGSVFCPGLLLCPTLRPLLLLSHGLFFPFGLPPPQSCWRGSHSWRSSVLQETESRSDSSVGELKSPGDGVSAAEAEAVTRCREQFRQRF